VLFQQNACQYDRSYECKCQTGRQVRPAAPRCVLCKHQLRLPFTYGAAALLQPVAMVLVLAIHTVATVSATVPFAMIMLR